MCVTVYLCLSLCVSLCACPCIRLSFSVTHPYMRAKLLGKWWKLLFCSPSCATYYQFSSPTRTLSHRVSMTSTWPFLAHRLSLHSFITSLCPYPYLIPPHRPTHGTRHTLSQRASMTSTLLWVRQRPLPSRSCKPCRRACSGHTTPLYVTPWWWIGQCIVEVKTNVKFFDFLDENRLIFVVLSGRFQNLFRKKERFWRLVVTATIVIVPCF